MVQVPNGAYGHYLLGRIARLTSRPEKAAAHFERCLTLNPMMWSAYEELCSLGAHCLFATCPCHLPYSPFIAALQYEQCCYARQHGRQCSQLEPVSGVSCHNVGTQKLLIDSEQPGHLQSGCRGV
jgi:hypothetical protein